MHYTCTHTHTHMHAHTLAQIHTPIYLIHCWHSLGAGEGGEKENELPFKTSNMEEATYLKYFSDLGTGTNFANYITCRPFLLRHMEQSQPTLPDSLNGKL